MHKFLGQNVYDRDKRKECQKNCVRRWWQNNLMNLSVFERQKLSTKCEFERCYCERFSLSADVQASMKMHNNAFEVKQLSKQTNSSKAINICHTFHEWKTNK